MKPAPNIEAALTAFAKASSVDALDAAYNGLVELCACDEDLDDEADFESGVDSMLSDRGLPSYSTRRNHIMAAEVAEVEVATPERVIGGIAAIEMNNGNVWDVARSPATPEELLVQMINAGHTPDDDDLDDLHGEGAERIWSRRLETSILLGNGTEHVEFRFYPATEMLISRGTNECVLIDDVACHPREKA